MTRWLFGIAACGLLIAAGLETWRRRWHRFNAPTLCDDWRGFLNGEPRIQPAKVPPVKPLKAQRVSEPVDRVTRFQRRGRG